MCKQYLPVLHPAFKVYTILGMLVHSDLSLLSHWMDPDLKSGIGMHELISTLNLPWSLDFRWKPPPPLAWQPDSQLALGPILAWELDVCECFCWGIGHKILSWGGESCLATIVPVDCCAQALDDSVWGGSPAIYWLCILGQQGPHTFARRKMVFLSCESLWLGKGDLTLKSVFCLLVFLEI